MPQQPGPPPADPEGPLMRFIAGLADLFYGPSAQSRRPDQMKEAVDRLVAEVVPEPPRPAARSAEDLAAETIAAAWESLEAGRDDAEELALTALRYWPNCADAYTLLGISAGLELEIALPLFTLAVMAGAEALGPDGFARYSGRFWDAPETRPFMVALGMLARANREAGAIDTAAAHFTELLNLNPRDNQGVRFELLGLALEVGNTETAEQVLAAFSADDAASFAYGRALLEFQRGGDSDSARLALRAARTANPHVVEYLTGRRELPDQMPLAGPPGSEAEALLTIEVVGRAWASTKGALEWVRKHSVPVAPPPPPKEKRSGPREV